MRKYLQKVNLKRILLLFFAICISLTMISTIHAALPEDVSNKPLITHERPKSIFKVILEVMFGAGSGTTSGGTSSTPTPSDRPSGEGTVTPTRTPTNQSPITSTSDAAQYADRVTSIVRASCRGYGIPGSVTIAEQSCLDNLKGTMNQDGIDEMIASTEVPPAYHLQCVGCSRAMAAARNYAYVGRGDAKQHIGLTVPGYTYTPTTEKDPRTGQMRDNKDKVKIGSLFFTNGGTWGHTGYITQIMYDEEGTPHSFKAFECNAKLNGAVSHEIVRSFGSVSGFQIPNNL